jgi:hypothetical protein
MRSQLDGASAPRYPSPVETPRSKVVTEARIPAVTAESVHWARIAHERAAAARHERIAQIAYLMAEARGFEPGHEAEDWLRAQSEVDAADAGIRRK